LEQLFMLNIKLNMKKFLKQLIIIVLSVVIGYTAIGYFNIEGFMLSTLFYLGVYIVVGLSVEMIWREIDRFKKKEIKPKQLKK